MKTTTMCFRLMRALFLYSLDMLTAIAGLIYGFGMTVQNWPALIGLMLGLRFFWHVLSMAFIRDDAKCKDGGS
jgi:hypothetical protein